MNGINNTWCSHCMKWLEYDCNGNCKKCGNHIDIPPKEYNWLELYGIDLTEIQPNRNNF